MGCPSSVLLGDNIVFSICTHDADTGESSDADSVPTYRIYEDEASTPIATGSMSKLDDANTTGYYTELLACTTGNGYERGKTYTVLVIATVDGITARHPFGFNVRHETFTETGMIDANMQMINDVTLTGDGSVDDKFDVV